jgi:hypothetical protein
LRFETVAAMAPMIALLSVVAVRVLQLRQAERQHPEAPASAVASGLERALVAAAAPGLSAEAMTVGQFVRAVARLGGFLGRRGDGAPGWKTLWRGYQRLQDMVAGCQRLQSAAPPAPRPASSKQRDGPRQRCW